MLKPSLVAKWIPRENSKYKDLFYNLAEYYYPYTTRANDSASLIIAKKKSYTHYRKVISYLNKHLDTTQIKQCSKQYSLIDFEKVTSVTHSKQKNAFLNVKKNNRNCFIQRSAELDRVVCGLNYKRYIQSI